MTTLQLAMPFFGLILLGFVSGKILRIDFRGLAWLNFFIVYIALPSFIYRYVSQAPFESLVNWPFIFATTLSAYFIFLIIFLVSVLILGSAIPRAAIQGSIASHGNISYMGIPLIFMVFGEKGVIPAILILCFDNMLHFFLIPLLQVFGGYEPGGWKATAGRVVAGVILHPFIIAAGLGITASWYAYELPAPLETVINQLGFAAIACALFALGVTIALQTLNRRTGWELPFISAAKLVVHPVLVFVILLVMGGFEPLWVQVAVLMAAMPTAVNVFVMASNYDVYDHGASSAVLFNTIISLFTIFALLLLIEKHQLPMTLFGLLG